MNMLQCFVISCENAGGGDEVGPSGLCHGFGSVCLIKIWKQRSKVTFLEVTGEQGQSGGVTVIALMTKDRLV